MCGGCGVYSVHGGHEMSPREIREDLADVDYHASWDRRCRHPNARPGEDLESRCGLEKKGQERIIVDVFVERKRGAVGRFCEGRPAFLRCDGERGIVKDPHGSVALVRSVGVKAIWLQSIRRESERLGDGAVQRAVQAIAVLQMGFKRLAESRNVRPHIRAI